MFITQPQKLSLTLFIYISLALTFSTSTEAKDYPSIQHRDHTNLKRLIRKRSPFPRASDGPLTALAGVVAPPPSSFPASSTSTTTISTSSAVSHSSDSASSSASTSDSSSSVSESSVSRSLSSSSSSSSSSSVVSTISSTTAPTSVPPETSETLNIGATSNNAAPSTAKPTVTRTESINAISTGATAAVPQSNSAKSKSTTLTVLIVIAASVGGVAILWTIFRKWKLGRSSKFDERLQPIDWQPTSAEEGIIPAHRRVNSGSSFHSGSGHGHGNAGYNGSEHGHAPASVPLPDHDFTAGPAALAPVGGYADLARGPSLRAQMQELNRGPGMGHHVYDVGVPLHHQAGYGGHDMRY